MSIAGTSPLRHGAARRPYRQARHRARWLVLFAAALILALALGVPSGSGHGAALAHAGDTHGTLTIIHAHTDPASGNPAGPAGANLVVQIQNANPSATYTLGYLPDSDAGCTAGNPTPLSDPSNVSTDGSGNVTFQLTWPHAATPGAYDLCAIGGDGSTTPLTSAKPFMVESSGPPAISIALEPTPNATAAAGNGGQATAGSGSAFSVGDQIVVNGTNFWPAGVSIDIYFSVAANPQHVTDLGQAAPVVSRLVDPTDSNGAFAVTVSVPGDQIGQVYLYAASHDKNLPGAFLPEDLASQMITVVRPTPTPTASPTATPDPTATTSTSTSPGGSGGGGTAGGNGLAIAALGTLSVLLLVVGSMLLISAGRQQPLG